jgi:hypothetical protein
MRHDHKGPIHFAQRTRSLIEDGSEDFTNIDEHMTRESKQMCHKVVANSSINISSIIKTGRRKQKQASNSPKPPIAPPSANRTEKPALK